MLSESVDAVALLLGFSASSEVLLYCTALAM